MQVRDASLQGQGHCAGYHPCSILPCCPRKLICSTSVGFPLFSCWLSSAHEEPHRRWEGEWRQCDYSSLSAGWTQAAFLLTKSLSSWQAPLNIASPSSGVLATHSLTTTHLGVRWTLFLTLGYCNIPCEFPAPCLHLCNSSFSKLPADYLKLHVPSQLSKLGPWLIEPPCTEVQSVGPK